jgi:hypothetical protein
VAVTGAALQLSSLECLRTLDGFVGCNAGFFGNRFGDMTGESHPAELLLLLLLHACNKEMGRSDQFRGSTS